MTDFLADIPPIRYEGPKTENEFAFRWYDPDAVAPGRRLADQLRFAVACRRDAKPRRRSPNREDPMMNHAGAMDVAARALRRAAVPWKNGAPEQLAARVMAGGVDPQPRSGRQERLETLLNRFV